MIKLLLATSPRTMTTPGTCSLDRGPSLLQPRPHRTRACRQCSVWFKLSSSFWLHSHSQLLLPVCVTAPHFSSCGIHHLRAELASPDHGTPMHHIIMGFPGPCSLFPDRLPGDVPAFPRPMTTPGRCKSRPMASSSTPRHPSLTTLPPASDGLVVVHYPFDMILSLSPSVDRHTMADVMAL